MLTASSNNHQGGNIVGFLTGDIMAIGEKLSDELILGIWVCLEIWVYPKITLW
jgi:hypothetical protein